MLDCTASNQAKRWRRGTHEKSIPNTMPYRWLQNHGKQCGTHGFCQCSFREPQILTAPHVCIYNGHHLLRSCCRCSLVHVPPCMKHGWLSTNYAAFAEVKAKSVCCSCLLVRDTFWNSSWSPTLSSGSLSLQFFLAASSLRTRCNSKLMERKYSCSLS